MICDPSSYGVNLFRQSFEANCMKSDFLEDSFVAVLFAFRSGTCWKIYGHVWGEKQIWHFRYLLEINEIFFWFFKSLIEKFKDLKVTARSIFILNCSSKPFKTKKFITKRCVHEKSHTHTHCFRKLNTFTEEF